MSILSTNHRLISIGESYSAGNGIDITDQVISVTGDAIPYSAGENIDIQDHIISGKDWSNDITEASSHAYNETTAWVKENYTNSADMTYISAVVDTKLDTSAWSSVSGDLATESYVVMSDNITYDRAKGYVDSKDYATEEFVNENTSGKLDSTAFTNWQNGQYSTDLQTIEGQISNKLDESAFGQVSGSFLTAINIPESAVWQDVSTTVQTNSAQWTEGGAGDEEVNSFVYNNSATINEVNTTYQANSGSYQPSGNYIPYTAVDSVFPAFETNSGLEIKTSTVAGSLYNTYINDFHISLSYLSPKIGIDNESLLTTGYLRFRTSSNSAYVDMEKIHTWDSASNYIQSNSANWNDVSTTVQSNSAQWGQGGEFPDSAYNAITSYQQNSGTYLTDNDIVNKLDISAFTAWSAQEFENDYELSAGEGVGFYEDNELKITRIDVTGGVLPYSAEEAITSYQTNSGNYLQKSEFKPTIGRGLTADSFSLAVGSYSKSFQYGLAIGEHTNRYVKNARSNAAIGYSAHAYGTGSQAFGEQVVVSAGMAIGKNNKTSACSFVIGNGTSNTSRNDIFVINYDGSVSAAGKISANGVELGAGGGNQEVESYVQTNSGTIDEAVTSYQNNSGTYLTSHQSISANEWNDCYNNVNTNSGAWASLPTYEYDNTNKISAINGSALAGGGDVPSGTMNTYGLEYNAVGEISAYNGSALTDVSLNNIVQTNSGSWGGSALPISTGPGVGLSVSDNKLVIRAVPRAFYTVGISDIILTSSLPVSPDANTLYLIQE